ncbi:Hus1-like protein-domain-containing protein [Lactarius indigo]|nr:Hus1-like protein-domain-containing protein [Lactarius indigo]
MEKLQKKYTTTGISSGTSMRVICNQREGGILVLFTDYRILFQSNNEITLNLPKGMNKVIMTLTEKKYVPVLSFKIFGMAQMGRWVEVAHDVCTEVMKPVDVALLTELHCPEPDVQIMLPLLTKMRRVVERMQNLSDVIAVHANSSGCLRLSTSTEVIKVDITWNNCSHPRMTGDDPLQDRAGAEAARAVTLRHIGTMSDPFRPHRGVLTFYIPSVLDD